MVRGRAYNIVGKLGGGAFGAVYKAELHVDGKAARTVALKVLHEGLPGGVQAEERFRDEARLLGLLHHRAIVQVEGLVQMGGRPVVVMEFVDGEDLGGILARGPIPVGPALEIAQEVMAALAVAFERPSRSGAALHLVHRDIKPTNIRVTTSGDVKLLDFGVARAEFAEREARTRSVTFGSTGYMSPERLEFQDSHAGDVFAMGVVLIESLTGRRLGTTSANPQKHAAWQREAWDRCWAATQDQEICGLIHEILNYDPQDRPTARAAEARLRGLRARYPQPGLLEWAETGVRPSRVESDGNSGFTWTEDSAEPSTSPPQSGGPSGVRGAVWAGVAVVGLLGLGGAVWALWPAAAEQGWVKREGWAKECWVPPDFAAAEASGGGAARETARAEARAALAEQWSGKHGFDGPFPAGLGDRVLGALDASGLESAAAANLAHCEARAAGGDGAPWVSWLQGLAPSPRGWYAEAGWAGECWYPADFARAEVEGGAEGRKTARAESLAALQAQWTGAHDAKLRFPERAVADGLRSLSGTEAVEAAAARNLEFCEAWARGEEDSLEGWTAWIQSFERRKGAPTPTPAPVEVVEAAPPAPVVESRPGRWSVHSNSDVDSAELVGGGRSYAQGSVPAGEYTLRASYRGEAYPPVTVRIGEGQSVTVQCQRAQVGCRVR